MREILFMTDELADFCKVRTQLENKGYSVSLRVDIQESKEYLEFKKPAHILISGNINKELLNFIIEIGSMDIPYSIIIDPLDEQAITLEDEFNVILRPSDFDNIQLVESYDEDDDSFFDEDFLEEHYE